MRFPPNFIARLRSHFLMSEIVGKRVPIKKHGREYHGLCPFHNEKSPSFTVNDEKAFFHCFGCGAHGDAIEFVRLFERLSYPETIERLARDAGIPLPQMTQEDVRRETVAKTLYDVLEAATQWFEKQLLSVGGTQARDYVEKRSLRPETQRSFRVGYAPDERTGLFTYLSKAGFSQSLQAEAGLIIVPENGAAYDRFRGRLMFPIRNVSGKVIAFGGRLIANPTANKNLPKYLNSPETPLFKKGELLYNLDLARKAAHSSTMAVVMEGYMDVVSTAQSGIAYAVATLGTAVTPEHLRLLWQMVKEPVMCLDGDEAGKRAMRRAAEVALPLLKPGYSLRFAVLPKGEDPDSYVQKHGKNSFEKILMTAPRLSQVIWDNLRQDQPGELNSPESFANLKAACARTSKLIADAVVRKEYETHFERHLYACSRDLWKKIRVGPKNTQPTSPQVMHMAMQSHSGALEMLVTRLLKLLVSFPQMLHKSHIEETLSRLDIPSKPLDALRHALLAAPAQSTIDDAAQFSQWLHREMHGDVLDNMMNNAPKLPYPDMLTIEDAVQLWNETVSAWQIAHLEFELQELQQKVGQTMDEAAYHRLVELQQTLHQARTSRTFASADADIDAA